MTKLVRRFCALTIALAPSVAAAQSKTEAATVPHRSSWTSDRREYVVGDVITIKLNEATMASTDKEQDGSDITQRQNDINLVPPKIGASALPTIAATMASDKNSSSQQSGAAQRNLTFTGDITVRIDSIDAHGVLHVKGIKVVDVDQNKQTLTFTGTVRPQDVGPDNIIPSTRVADAQLAYKVDGALGKTRGGIIGRLLSWFWP